MEDDRIFRLNLHKFPTSAVTEYSVHMIFVIRVAWQIFYIQDTKLYISIRRMRLSTIHVQFSIIHSQNPVMQNAIRCFFANAARMAHIGIKGLTDIAIVTQDARNWVIPRTPAIPVQCSAKFSELKYVMSASKRDI